MNRAATLDRQKQNDASSENEAREDAKIRKEIDGYVAACQGKLYDRLMSSATRAQYESMFAEFREKKELQYAKESEGLLLRTLDRMEKDERKMLESIESYSAEDAAEMTEWFEDDGLLDMFRTAMLDAKIHEFRSKHDVLWDRRTKLMEKMKQSDLEDGDGFEHLEAKKFASLDFAAKKNLLNRLESLDLAATLGQKRLYRETQRILAKATAGEGRYLHPNAAGKFLKHMMQSPRPEDFQKETLLPSLEEHRETRLSFDAFEIDAAQADAKTIKIPSLETFLAWDASKRSSFVAEGRRRMENQARLKKEETEGLESAKDSIEACMRTEKWEDAESLLHDAMKTHPANKELTVMWTYVELHREEDEETQEENRMDAIKRDITALVATLPSSLRDFYGMTLLQGSDTFETVTKQMERGVKAADAKPEPTANAPKTIPTPRTRPQKPAATRKTAAAKKNHGDDPDEDHDDAAEKPEEEPTEITVEKNSKDERIEALSALTRERLFEDPREKALTFDGISAERQSMIVRHLNNPILQGLQTLQSHGERYELAA